jgi:hypothetical protein
MTEQLERLVGPAEALEIAHGGTTQAAAGTPALITEAEVAFSTAAAVPLRPVTTGWRRGAAGVAVALRRTLQRSATDEAPKTRHYPKRLGYLEDARMQREMGRS